MHEKEVPRMCNKRGFLNKEPPKKYQSSSFFWGGYFDTFYLISLINI
jgi:hypothetical protein